MSVRARSGSVSGATRSPIRIERPADRDRIVAEPHRELPPAHAEDREEHDDDQDDARHGGARIDPQRAAHVKARRPMLFNSLEFALFLPRHARHLLPAASPRHRWRARKIFLVVASYVFYMSWNPVFGLLLLGSTLVDFTMGLALERTHRPRRAPRAAPREPRLQPRHARLLQVRRVRRRERPSAARRRRAAALGHRPAGRHLVLHVPVAGLHDRRLPRRASRRGPARLRALRLVLPAPGRRARSCGRAPSCRSSTRRPPIRRPATSRTRSRASRRASARRSLLADVLGAIRRRASGRPRRSTRRQRRCSRSTPTRSRSTSTSPGYTDIALGVSRLFGFELPENFDAALSRAEPARVLAALAHLALDVAARLPLRPARRQPRRALRTYVNLLVTMVLGGLWHGAAWTFVVWGAFHGLLLAVHRVLASRRPRRARGRSAACSRSSARSTWSSSAGSSSARRRSPTRSWRSRRLTTPG